VKVEEILILETIGVLIEKQRLSPDECEALARRDGFENFSEMMKFWDGRLPFRGTIIHWRKSND
jgi:hypothetical protein